MSNWEKIQRAQALLKAAQEKADAADDYMTADDVGYAIACSRSAGIMAGGFDSVRGRAKTPSRGDWHRS